MSAPTPRLAWRNAIWLVEEQARVPRELLEDGEWPAPKITGWSVHARA
jgi:hypothetical protein